VIQARSNKGLYSNRGTCLGPKEDREERLCLPLSLGYKLVTTPLTCCHVIFLYVQELLLLLPALHQRRRNHILDKIDCPSNMQKRNIGVFAVSTP
jgi:hypothetical protein